MGEERESKIPVFTVIKNGAILKNIFVINKPEQESQILTIGRHPDCNIMLTHPSISRFHLQIYSKPSSQKFTVVDLSSVHGTWVSGNKIDPGVAVELNEGDTIKLGGSTRVYKLHWIPLCSAYDMENQFVSAMEEEKEEETAVESDEGMNMLSTKNECAEEKDSLLVEKKEEQTSQEMNMLSTKNECAEEKDSLLVEKKEEQTSQSSVPAEEEELLSMEWILEGLASMFCDPSSGLVTKKEIPSAPPMPENMNCSIFDDDETAHPMPEIMNCSVFDDDETGNPWRNSLEKKQLSSNISGDLSLVVESPSESQNMESLPSNMNCSIFDDDETAHPMPENMNCSVFDDDETENPWRNSLEKKQLSSNISGDLSLVVESPSESQNMESLPSNIDPSFTNEQEIYSATEIIEETENKSLQESQQKVDVFTEPHLMESIKSTFQEEDIFFNTINSQQVHEQYQISNPLSALKPMEEMENNENAEALQEEDYESENTCFCFASLATESVDSSLRIVEDDKRNPTPQSVFAPIALSECENLRSSPLRLETKSNSQSIWSRRGKPASVLQLQTGKADAENNEAVPKSLFVSSDEKEIYTPDKENFTPNNLLMRELKRKGKLEETKHSSSKATLSPHLQLEDNMNASDKENQTPKLMKSTRNTSRKQSKLEKEMVIKGKAERDPFQSLLVESASKTVSEASVPNTTAPSWKSMKIEKRIAYPSLNKSVGVPRRTYTMVADTTSLMDKESRRSLKILQGLKGTQLIIPRTVVRELDCLKRRGSLFRRKTEASSALEWIEMCILNTKWWIHVQSTMEERGPIAPTPPATPHSHFSEDSAGNSFGPFSARGSLMEIATPTAEDHILDYALLSRKMKSGGDGHLVLLSNDVTLKIKAMAEGLICETVQEFRDSLVNPFSERFMWADSSPRGQTWSVKDDMILRDKYNRYPLKKPSKGDTKGLKLILLHNSHYGQISSIR